LAVAVGERHRVAVVVEGGDRRERRAQVDADQLALVHSGQWLLPSGSVRAAHAAQRSKRRWPALLRCAACAARILYQPLAPLVGRPHQDDAAVGAGDGALDEHQVVVDVDAYDGEVADGDALVAVLAGHADALLGPAAAA